MAEASVDWKSRITGYSKEPPATLRANPSNFRRHPLGQREAFRGIAGSIGLVAPVLMNDRTGHLLDGHMRVEEAITNGIELLDVTHVDLSEGEEAIILAMFDSVAAMAYDDVLAARQLYAEIEEHGPDATVEAFLRRTLSRYGAGGGGDGALPTSETEDYGDNPVNAIDMRDSTLNRYQTTKVRQIMIGFTEEEYLAVLPRFEAVTKATNAQNQWETLKALISYASTLEAK